MSYGEFPDNRNFYFLDKFEGIKNFQHTDVKDPNYILVLYEDDKKKVHESAYRKNDFLSNYEFVKVFIQNTNKKYMNFIISKEKFIKNIRATILITELRKRVQIMKDIKINYGINLIDNVFIFYEHQEVPLEYKFYNRFFTLQFPIINPFKANINNKNLQGNMNVFNNNNNINNPSNNRNQNPAQNLGNNQQPNYLMNNPNFNNKNNYINNINYINNNYIPNNNIFSNSNSNQSPNILNNINYKSTGTIEKIIEENKKLKQYIDNMFAINFISVDQNVNCPVVCKKTDNFKKLEEKLYQDYKELKNKNLVFIVNGGVINRNETLENNGIKPGSAIVINIMD